MVNTNLSGELKTGKVNIKYDIYTAYLIFKSKLLLTR